MPKQTVSTAATGLSIDPSRLFIEVTPAMRRALELLAEASITLLDEIDAPVDGLEADPDFEWLAEDDEDGGDAEPDVDEPDLGWTEDGDLGGGETITAGGDGDEDVVAAATSVGFVPVCYPDLAARAEAKALFDPRLGLRAEPPTREWIEQPNGLRFAPGAWTHATIPAFPHDPPGRPAFFIDGELRRLRAALAAKPKRGRRAHHRIGFS